MSEPTFTQSQVDEMIAAAVQARVKNHGAKMAEITAERDALAAKVEETTAAVKERDKLAKLVGELEGRVAETSDRLALSGVGISDEKAAKRLRTAYRSDVEGVEKPPSFAEWLAGDGADDVARFAPVATAAGAAAATAATAETSTAAVGAARGGASTTTATTRQAAGAVKLSPELYAAQMAKLLEKRGAAPAGPARTAVDVEIASLKASRV